MIKNILFHAKKKLEKKNSDKKSHESIIIGGGMQNC